MKFTLRQAHKLVEKITARIATLNISPTREVNVWQADETSFETLQADFDKSLSRQMSLVAARYFIREQIGVANRAEVDSLVAQRKFLLDQIGTLRAVVADVRAHAITSPDALAEKAKATIAAATAGASRGYGDDTVTVCLIDDEALTVYNKKIDALQLKVESIEDQLTSANANRDSCVIVSDAVLAVLKEEGIVT